MRARTGIRLPAAGAVILTAVACSGSATTGAGWQHETTVAGTVTTVRTTAGSVWGGTARLVEEASIGSPDGPDEYLIGQVVGVAASEERIYVLDRQPPVVRVYDYEGNHLFSFGRDGDGPGEFRNPLSIARHPHDGRIFVRDSRTGRINVYTPDGEPLDTLRISATFNTSRAFTMTDEGTLYSPTLLNPGVPLTEWRMGMISYSTEGADSDTIPAPDLDFEPWQIIGSAEGKTSSSNVPFSPAALWAFASNRAMVGGVSTNYRFEVRWPDGRTTVIEREWEKVPVDRDEARWFEKIATQNMRDQFPGWVWNGRAIPSHKPPYDALVPDLSERVWVGREGPGARLPGCAEDAEDTMEYFRNPCWEATSTWEVFRMSGEFLGEVDVPEGLQIGRVSHIRDDTVIAAFTGEDGTPYVKRYRLVTP